MLCTFKEINIDAAKRIFMIKCTVHFLKKVRRKHEGGKKGEKRK
jgi:hypothetical protein